MQILKTFRLAWAFYKSYALFSMFITLFCIRIVYSYGLQVFTSVFWGKVITSAIAWYFVNESKRNEFYYYRNLGISPARLWILTLIFDFVCFLSLVIITYKLA